MAAKIPAGSAMILDGVEIICGGSFDGRALDTESRFEVAVDRALGAGVRGSDAAAIELYQALSNPIWRHVSGDAVQYSFRAAGDLVAAIRGAGTYLDWYCSGREAVVADHVAVAMAAEGWTWEPAYG